MCKKNVKKTKLEEHRLNKLHNEQCKKYIFKRKRHESVYKSVKFSEHKAKIIIKESNKITNISSNSESTINPSTGQTYTNTMMEGKK